MYRLTLNGVADVGITGKDVLEYGGDLTFTASRS